MNHIIVAGTPGALTNVVSRYLNKMGWLITWPGQDLSISGVKEYLKKNSFNLELHRIHEDIYDSAGVSLLSLKFPYFYELPYPGPKEYLDQFPKPAVLACSLLPPVLDVWRFATDTVIDVQCNRKEDLDALTLWAKGRLDHEKLKQVCSSYSNQYYRHLSLFPNIITINNSELKHGKFNRLEKHLNL
jgi:hypothetical protein